MSYVFDTMRSVFSRHVAPMLRKAGKEDLAMDFEALIEEMHSANHKVPSPDGVFNGDGINKHGPVERAARELEECAKKHECPSTYRNGQYRCEKDRAHLNRVGDVQHEGGGQKWLTV